MVDGRHIENRFSRNSAVDCPILVKFFVGKQFSQNFSHGTDTHLPQSILFCFVMLFSEMTYNVSSETFNIIYYTIS